MISTNSIQAHGATSVDVWTASATMLVPVCAGFEGTLVPSAGLRGSGSGSVSVQAKAESVFQLKPWAADEQVREQVQGLAAVAAGLGGGSVRGYEEQGQQSRHFVPAGGTRNGLDRTDSMTRTNGTNPIDPWELRISSPPG